MEPEVPEPPRSCLTLLLGGSGCRDAEGEGTLLPAAFCPVRAFRHNLQQAGAGELG